MILTAEQLTALRTGRPAGSDTGRPRWTPEELAARQAQNAALAAEIKRIGAICDTCEEKYDCPFTAQSACARKRQIKDGTAVCPEDMWTLQPKDQE